MIAIDTNILVYCHRPEFAEHRACRYAVESLAASGRRFSIPWPCVHEFIATVTHRRRFAQPTPSSDAIGFLLDFETLPQFQFLTETTGHLQRLEAHLSNPIVSGPRVHDARIAAICLSHGISEFWSADRDFSYFPALRVLNPASQMPREWR
jgi:toxin-antitoxin system PIN domain toxin